MPYRLLLADDSPTIQKVVELVLSPENFEIKTVDNGEDALEIIDSFQPDIVLADIDMPRLNGYQLCEKIKRDPKTSSIPVILLAGAFEPFDKNHAKSVLADDYITKPFESKELINKVQALLASYESFKEPDVSGWDEEIPVEEKEETEAFNEEFESEAALPEIEKEFSEILDKEKKVSGDIRTELKESIRFPSEEEIGSIIQDVIKEKLTRLIENNILPYLSFSIKDSVESAISNTAPKIIEDITRSIVKELILSLKDDIRLTINNVIPQIAEEIIKKEIERIASEVNNDRA